MYASNNIINEKMIENLLNKLKIGKEDEHEETEDNHSGHDHERRRRHTLTSKSFQSSPVYKIPFNFHMEEKQPSTGRYRRSTEEHNDNHNENRYQKVHNDYNSNCDANNNSNNS